jgi:hypothetical protein
MQLKILLSSRGGRLSKLKPRCKVLSIHFFVKWNGYNQWLPDIELFQISAFFSLFFRINSSSTAGTRIGVWNCHAPREHRKTTSSTSFAYGLKEVLFLICRVIFRWFQEMNSQIMKCSPPLPSFHQTWINVVSQIKTNLSTRKRQGSLGWSRKESNTDALVRYILWPFNSFWLVKKSFRRILKPFMVQVSSTLSLSLQSDLLDDQWGKHRIFSLLYDWVKTHLLTPRSPKKNPFLILLSSCP